MFKPKKFHGSLQQRLLQDPQKLHLLKNETAPKRIGDRNLNNGGFASHDEYSRFV